MSYRKLVMDDIEYRYTTGSKFTKVVGPDNKVKLFKNTDIGTPIYSTDLHPHELYAIGREGKVQIEPDLSDVFHQIKRWIVSPKNVVNALKGFDRPVFKCEKHNVETIFLCYDCFDREINEKKTPVIRCNDCQIRSWEDT